MTSISPVVSVGTPERWHNSITKNLKGREVHFCLDLMAISYEVNIPRLIYFVYMINTNMLSYGGSK